MPVWTWSLLMAIGRALFWGGSHQIKEITLEMRMVGWDEFVSSGTHMITSFTHVYQVHKCSSGTQINPSQGEQEYTSQAQVTTPHTWYLKLPLWYYDLCWWAGGVIGSRSTQHMEAACKLNTKLTIHPFAFRFLWKWCFFMTVTMIVRTTMVIVSSCNIALKCGVHTDERTDVHGRHARSVLYPHLC